jgi:hypothetical protein
MPADREASEEAYDVAADMGSKAGDCLSRRVESACEDIHSQHKEQKQQRLLPVSLPAPIHYHVGQVHCHE